MFMNFLRKKSGYFLLDLFLMGFRLPLPRLKTLRTFLQFLWLVVGDYVKRLLMPRFKLNNNKKLVIVEWHQGLLCQCESMKKLFKKINEFAIMVEWWFYNESLYKFLNLHTIYSIVS